jgi:DNA (cytosine-5)-methyltransferase 1
MSENAPYSFYEFFAGGGMARLGLGTHWSCSFANDFDPVKASSYLANFPESSGHFNQGDVWKVGTKDLPGQAMLAWASSPCQDFSLAGARAGLSGGRSSAFFGFWSLIQKLNAEQRAPAIVVIENVVGLLTSHGGDDFSALCQSLYEEGYWFGAVEIDAGRFLPQSRPRVFVIASKDPPPESLTLIEPKPPLHSPRMTLAYDGLSGQAKKRWVWWRLPYPPSRNVNLESVLDADDEVEWFDSSRSDRLLSILHPRHRTKLDVALERNSRTVGTVFRRMRVENGKKVQRAELNFSGIAGCLRVPRGGSSQQFLVVVEHGSTKIRGLTSREAFNLMGLPPDYLLPRSRTAALSIAGDGVATPVVRYLSDSLLIPLAQRHSNCPEKATTVGALSTI